MQNSREDETKEEDDNLEDSNDCDVKEKTEVGWSGSGIWERTENRRWEVVKNHIIPQMDRSLQEIAMVSDLGVGHYLQNFESEMVVSQPFRIITCGSTMIRVTVKVETETPAPPLETPAPPLETVEEEEEEEPVAGPSGCLARPNFNITSNPRSKDVLLTTEEPQSSPKSSPKHNFVRNKRNQRKRKKNRQRRFISLARRSRLVVLSSAESSPGRRTPSPDTLARICLYWEKRLSSPEYIIPSESDSD